MTKLKKIRLKWQNEGQNHSLLTANKYFENVADFMYLGTAETN
jgi:hypothetical protein